MEQSPAQPVSARTHPVPPGTALYVHLPFCAAKCTYCDFFSLPAAGQDLSGVLEDILREARLWSPRSPRTVFLGGGTPSLYPAPLLQRLLDELDHITGWRSSAVEVTAECNPESLDGHKAEFFLSQGITRLSVGVQSLDPKRLAWYGRVHSPEQAWSALAAARSAGCTRLSADLIYGAPDQGLDAWRRELDAVLSFGVDHLSAYNLTVEPGTALARWHERGEFHSLEDEQELAQFHAARELCRAAGLDAYEVSNYAGKGQECQHNITYWQNGEYLGIGPSAVSKIGATRFGNGRALELWRRPLALGRVPSTWSETLDGPERLGETWWLGLRLAQGLSPEEARQRAGWWPAASEVDRAERIAQTLAEQGLLVREGARYRLSERGLEVADGVGRSFLAESVGSAPQNS